MKRTRPIVFAVGSLCRWHCSGDCLRFIDRLWPRSPRNRKNGPPSARAGRRRHRDPASHLPVGRPAARARWQARRPMLAKGGRHRPFRLVLDKNAQSGNFRLPGLGRRRTLLRRLDGRRRASLVRNQAERHPLGGRRLRAVLQTEPPTSPSTSSFRPILACWFSRWLFPGVEAILSPSRQRLRWGARPSLLLKGTLDQPGDRDRGLECRGSHPVVGFRHRRRKAEAGRRVALCTMPI